MHIISKKKLIEFWEKHPNSKNALTVWFRIMYKSNYTTLNQLKESFPKADLVNGKIVFDIGGNKYRLIAAIHFNRNRIYIRDVLTHEDYNKGEWKNG